MVTFAPGETSAQVTVQVNGDRIVEPDEVFEVNFADVTGNATIADGQAMATIVNDDQPATAQPPAGLPATDRPPPSVRVDAPGRKRGSQRFALGKVRLNTRTGTATIAVTVPGPGRLAMSAGGGKAGRVPTRRVKAAGTVQLLIKASGKQRRTLVRTGRATVRVTITYTPIGGRPSSRSRSVRLRTAH